MSAIIPVVPLKGEISGVQELSGSINAVGSLEGGLSVDLAQTPYSGPYEVDPRKVEQILDTAHKSMARDVTVNAIAYIEVGNLSGGTTATIGYE